MFDLCSASGGAHCPHHEADRSVPCCYCGPVELKLGEEAVIPDAARERMVAETIADARKQGCNCDPEVELIPLGSMPGIGISAAKILHDDDCALMKRLERVANAPNN